jgi:hypothetical protein
MEYGKDRMVGFKGLSILRLIVRANFAIYPIFQYSSIPAFQLGRSPGLGAWNNPTEDLQRMYK